MAGSSLTSTVGMFGLSAVGGYLFGPVGFAAGALVGSLAEAPEAALAYADAAEGQD